MLLGRQGNSLNNQGQIDSILSMSNFKQRHATTLQKATEGDLDLAIWILAVRPLETLPHQNMSRLAVVQRITIDRTNAAGVAYVTSGIARSLLQSQAFSFFSWRWTDPFAEGRTWRDGIACRNE